MKHAVHNVREFNLGR